MGRLIAFDEDITINEMYGFNTNKVQSFATLEPAQFRVEVNCHNVDKDLKFIVKSQKGRAVAIGRVSYETFLAIEDKPGGGTVLTTVELPDGERFDIVYNPGKQRREFQLHSQRTGKWFEQTIVGRAVEKIKRIMWDSAGIPPVVVPE